MPITEIVRALADWDGVVDGRPARVALIYDVDGRGGPDEQAIGWPRFWLRVERDGGAEVRGPFEHEDDALDAVRGLGIDPE